MSSRIMVEHRVRLEALYREMGRYLPAAYLHATPVSEPNYDFGGVSEVRYLSRRDDGGLYIKAQLNYRLRSARHPTGVTTARLEREAIRLMAADAFQVPEVMWFAEAETPDGRFSVLVTRELAGFTSLHALLRDPGLGARHRDALLDAVATALARLHAARWRHGACYPKHIYLKPAAGGFEVAFIDLETSYRCVTRLQAERKDLPRLTGHLTRLSPGLGEQFLSLYRRASRHPAKNPVEPLPRPPEAA